MTTKRIKKKMAKRDAIKERKYLEAARVALWDGIAAQWEQLPRSFVKQAFDQEFFGCWWEPTITNPPSILHNQSCSTNVHDELTYYKPE